MASSCRAVVTLLCAGLVAPAARAGSVAASSVSLGGAVGRSERIIEGTVLGTAPFHFEDHDFHSVEIRVDKVLRGVPAQPREVVRVFSPAEWFQHTHAAAIRGGVISYEDPRYATPVPGAEIKTGAILIAFLGHEKPPEAFPKNAAFLTCADAYDRPAREAEVLAIKLIALDEVVALKMGQRAVLPDGLQLEVLGHSHKRPMTDGPRRETAEVRVSRGGQSQVLLLGHVVPPDGKGGHETWDRGQWQGHELELLGMKYDTETTLRVRRKVNVP